MWIFLNLISQSTNVKQLAFIFVLPASVIVFVRLKTAVGATAIVLSAAPPVAVIADMPVAFAVAAGVGEECFGFGDCFVFPSGENKSTPFSGGSRLTIFEVLFSRFNNLQQNTSQPSEKFGSSFTTKNGG